MSMIEVVPFHPHHAEDVLPKVNLRKDFLSKDQLEYMHLYGLAISIRDFGKFMDYNYMAFGGLLPLWDGVAELYTFLTDEVKQKYPLFLHKTSKKFVEDMQKKFSLHRIQFNVLEGDPVAYRWAQGLGFVEEGLMSCFTTNKENFIRFARIWH